MFLFGARNYLTNIEEFLKQLGQKNWARYLHFMEFAHAISSLSICSRETMIRWPQIKAIRCNIKIDWKSCQYFFGSHKINSRQSTVNFTFKEVKQAFWQRINMSTYQRYQIDVVKYCLSWFWRYWIFILGKNCPRLNTLPSKCDVQFFVSAFLMLQMQKVVFLRLV